MAFSLNDGSHDEDPVAEINVTPFVDVVLVLLIIFMITAAVVEFGMQIGVPPTRVASTPQSNQEFSVVQILSDGRIAQDGKEVNLYQIVPTAKQANPEDPKVYVRVHRSATYADVAQVLAECRAGEVEVNLISRPLQRDPRIR